MKQLAANSDRNCACKSTVMYVDDCALNLFTIENYCKMMKVPCITFTFGEEAVRHYEATLAKRCCSKGIPIVVTDIQMPEMDGFEVARQIKELDQNTEGVRHRVILLALTSSVTEKVDKNAKKVGIQDVLSKPIAYEDFKTIIMRLYLPFM